MIWPPKGADAERTEIACMVTSSQSDHSSPAVASKSLVQEPKQPISGRFHAHFFQFLSDFMISGRFQVDFVISGRFLAESRLFVQSFTDPLGRTPDSSE